MRISANLLTCAPFRKLACALGIMVTLAPPGSAAPPAPAGDQDAQVEMYYGTRRVELEKPRTGEGNAPRTQGTESKGPEGPELPKTSPSEKRAVTAEGVLEASLPPGISKWLPCLYRPAPVIPAASNRSPVIKTALWLEGLRARLLTIPEAPRRLAATENTVGESKPVLAALLGAVAQEPKPARSGAVPETQPVVPARPEQASDAAAQGFFSKTIVQVALIFALALTAPIVSVLCCLWLLRQQKRTIGPAAQPDHSASLVTVTGPFAASAPSVAGADVVPPSLDRGGKLEDLQVGWESDTALTEETSQKPSEESPTSDNKRPAKKKRAKTKEDGVLHQLFEENLRLREQIDQVPERETFREFES